MKYKSENDKNSISILIDCSIDDLIDSSSYFHKLLDWFSTNSNLNNNEIDKFLNNLDTFEQVIKQMLHIIKQNQNVY